MRLNNVLQHMKIIIFKVIIMFLCVYIQIQYAQQHSYYTFTTQSVNIKNIYRLYVHIKRNYNMIKLMTFPKFSIDKKELKILL